MLTNGPLFNTGPMNILTTPALAAGATVTIQREFEPGAMLEEIERRGITLAISAPAMTKALVAHERWEATDLSSLRHVITGSATVREDALAPWFDRGVCVLQDYGLTEAMPVVTMVPREDAHRLRAHRGTAGRALPRADRRRRRLAAAGRGGRRGARAGPDRHARVLAQPAGHRARRSTTTAGCERATPGSSTTRAC